MANIFKFDTQLNQPTLFGTTPDEYRRMVRSRQMTEAGQAGMGGAIGYGISRLFGGDMSNDPTYQRMQNIQQIKQDAINAYKGNDVPGKIQAVAKALINAGEMEIGMNLMSQYGGGGLGDFSGFDNKKQFLDAEKSFREEARKELKPFEQAIQYYNDTAAIKGGDITKWTGTDDFFALRNALKQSLPNESVMGDDLANIRMASGGLPGWAEAWRQRLLGKGEQGLQARRELLASMHGTATTRAKRRDKIRQWYGGIGTDSGFDTNRILKGSQEVTPLSTSAGAVNWDDL